MSHDGTTSQQSDECHERDGELDRAQLPFLPGLHRLERPASAAERIDRDERQRRDDREGAALEQQHRPEGPHADHDVDELARELDRVPAPLAQSLGDADHGKDVDEGSEQGNPALGHW
jgi:hypothetical protein